MIDFVFVQNHRTFRCSVVFCFEKRIGIDFGAVEKTILKQ